MLSLDVEGSGNQAPIGRLVKGGNEPLLTFPRNADLYEKLAVAANLAYATRASTRFDHGGNKITVIVTVTEGGNEPRLMFAKSELIGEKLASAASYACTIRSSTHFDHNHRLVSVIVTSSSNQQMRLPFQL